MSETCIVIPRVCPWADGQPYAAWLDDDNKVRIELFFPYDLVNYGHIAVWDSGHNEADLGYFHSRTRAPITPAEKEAATKAVTRYQNFLKSLGQFELIVHERLPRDWRERAWA